MMNSNQPNQTGQAIGNIGSNVGLMDTIAGGSSSGSSGAGMGGMGTFGWIGAAIIAQMMATDSNPRVMEDGSRVGDIRHGHYTTEPWLDRVGAAFGWDATPGAEFDAGNEKAFGGAIDYWTDPMRGGIRYAAENTMGGDAANIVDPVGFLNQEGLNAIYGIFS